ncbi:hypothetical protein [Candidatus Paracaedibacter symbiosus]|uniref:hypothetical protein n=1 Tax=Candidatus Paracaedibacter symbiosus TaxID=244582 RepID=UPI00068A6D51|nr:hypothetical protein [Candidatus Paracaedibacter symbiosus]
MKTKISFQTKNELLNQARSNYRLAKRFDKIKIINNITEIAGYGRKYAIILLNRESKAISLLPKSTIRKTLYNEDVKRALITAWQAANCICGKRLAPFLKDLVAKLEKHGHLSLPNNVRTKLFSISPATIDRLLSKERIQNSKGLSTTKSGSLLKKQIKVRTFADWNETTPGFLKQI